MQQFKNIGTLLVLLLFMLQAVIAQDKAPKGALFIIGGGERTAYLMDALYDEADLKPDDLVLILPMASEYPDTAVHYVARQFLAKGFKQVQGLNFSKADTHDAAKLALVRQAKLIYMTGGDQNRLMDIIANSPLHNALLAAYANGATIAGTSAGAAVMSEQMISGQQLLDTTYKATFDKVWANNIAISQGLGLLKNVIIDQHFIRRSRYNRLFSALADYPQTQCIGIDESTAIVVRGTLVKVVGESQVVLASDMQQFKKTAKGLVTFSDIRLSFYADGQSFSLTKSP